MSREKIGRNCCGESKDYLTNSEQNATLCATDDEQKKLCRHGAARNREREVLVLLLVRGGNTRCKTVFHVEVWVMACSLALHLDSCPYIFIEISEDTPKGSSRSEWVADDTSTTAIIRLSFYHSCIRAVPNFPSPVLLVLEMLQSLKKIHSFS